jgi:ribosomal-protein-alanine acetyltransferase
MTVVRAAKPADREAVAALDARVFADGAEAVWSPRSVEAEFAALGDTRRIIVAADRGVVVGHAMLLAAGDVGDLTRVAVDESHRRLGIATRLVERLVEEATAIGLEAVVLEVAEGNAPAVALYERLGFAQIDRRRAYYADGSDAVVMRRRLTSVVAVAEVRP